jgi:hypothetical protein
MRCSRAHPQRIIALRRRTRKASAPHLALVLPLRASRSHFYHIILLQKPRIALSDGMVWAMMRAFTMACRCIIARTLVSTYAHLSPACIRGNGRA